MVLDIGNPVIEAIPVGQVRLLCANLPWWYSLFTCLLQRIVNGLFQTFAVRAAGFSIVPLAQVAPALQLLYVVMMYIAVYPIALSIRSSNVYESQALGEHSA
jgi:Trk-type K+ transport system membrane component